MAEGGLAALRLGVVEFPVFAGTNREPLRFAEEFVSG
jgi:hypothetical protein